MGQDTNSLITGLADSINKYMGLGIQNQMEQGKEQRKNEAALNLKTQEAALDLSGKSALEAYKLTLEGKVDPETATKMHPEAAKWVDSFTQKNGRNPTVSEFDKLFESKGRAQDISDRQNARFIQQHANNLAKDSIPELMNSYNELADQFQKGNIEGVGVAESYISNLFTGEQGIRNRTNLQQMANAILKSRSGAAVSDQEYKRFLEELQGGKLPDEKSIKTHVSKIGTDMKTLINLRESGLPKSALEEYYSRPGAIKSGDVKEIKFDAKKAPSAEGTTKSGTKFKVLG